MDKYRNTNMDDDVEPERYYEWILWKLRKEKSMTIEYTIQKEKSETFDERISLRKENAELRKQIELLKIEVATMNKEKYGLLNRIKELNDLRDSVIR